MTIIFPRWSAVQLNFFCLYCWNNTACCEDNMVWYNCKEKFGDVFFFLKCYPGNFTDVMVWHHGMKYFYLLVELIFLRLLNYRMICLFKSFKVTKKMSLYHQTRFCLLTSYSLVNSVFISNLFYYLCIYFVFEVPNDTIHAERWLVVLSINTCRVL